MADTFKTHLRKFIDIDDDEFVHVRAFFTQETVKKKTDLMREGEKCKWHYFVLKGCLRKFFVNEKGVEHTTEFAIENWWLTDNIAFERQEPTLFFIQAVETSEILKIDQPSQQQLLLEHPKLERYFRFIYQRAFASAQMRIKHLYGFTKDELYEHLNQSFPDFIQRVPQYLVASYLGFTPEYLSELRKKKSRS